MRKLRRPISRRCQNVRPRSVDRWLRCGRLGGRCLDRARRTAGVKGIRRRRRRNDKASTDNKKGANRRQRPMNAGGKRLELAARAPAVARRFRLGGFERQRTRYRARQIARLRDARTGCEGRFRGTRGNADFERQQAWCRPVQHQKDGCNGARKASARGSGMPLSKHEAGHENAADRVPPDQS
jgi:hypothetical protein